MKRYSSLLILSVIGLAAFLRLYGLGSLGMGFFRDEAAIGYNIFSILKTWRDEFGQLLPVIFRSFEVFFLPAYFYLSVPIMAILRLSPFSTRLLSAIAGVVAVYLIYLLAKKIIPAKKCFPLAAALLLAVSPWHLFFSRGAFEGNLALTFFAAGVYFFVNFLDGKERHLTYSLVLFTLSMYSYQSERLVVPLWLFICALIYRKKFLLLGWRKLFIFSLPALAVGLPLLFIWLSPAGLHRAAGVSLFSENANFSGGVLRKIAAMYVSYFSPKNLFWLGDYDLERSLVGMSVFFFWLVPGFFIGLYRLRAPWLWAWLLLAPLPASLTPDPFHTYRSLLIYFPLTIFIAYGWTEILSRFRKLLPIVFGFLLFSLVQLATSYLYVTPYERAYYWDQPFKQTVEAINKYAPTAEKVVVDTSYSEPYIHYLFWSKYDPKKLQGQSLKLDYYGSSERIRYDHIDNIYFENVDWPTRRGDSGTIFVVPHTEVPPSEFITDPKVKLLDTTYFPNGEAAFRLLLILK